VTNEQVSACPVCGAYGGTSLAEAPALLAVCDVLVVRALEQVGKRIVRAGDRSTRGSRFRQMGTRPWHEAHTLWKPTADMVDKGLFGSWDVIPAMLDNHGCCGVTSRQVQEMVDTYVRDLLVTGTAHNITDLRYRFERYLGIPLTEPVPYSPEPLEA
jgi:hypothetical protein